MRITRAHYLALTGLTVETLKKRIARGQVPRSGGDMAMLEHETSPERAELAESGGRRVYTASAALLTVAADALVDGGMDIEPAATTVANCAHWVAGRWDAVREHDPAAQLWVGAVRKHPMGRRHLGGTIGEIATQIVGRDMQAIGDRSPERSRQLHLVNVSQCLALLRERAEEADIELSRTWLRTGRD